MNIIYLMALIVFEIAWLWCLAAHLQNKDVDPTDKICWTLVLCTLNLVGFFLFIFVGPKSKTEIESEEDLKKAFNEGRR